MPEKINLVNENGSSIQADLVSVFKINETYAITTNNEVDPNGLTILHVSEVHGNKFTAVSNDANWDAVKGAMRAIISGSGNGNFTYEAPMDRADAVTGYSRDISVEKAALNVMQKDYQSKKPAAPVAAPVPDASQNVYGNSIYPTQGTTPVVNNMSNVPVGSAISQGISEIKPQQQSDFQLVPSMENPVDLMYQQQPAPMPTPMADPMMNQMPMDNGYGQQPMDPMMGQPNNIIQFPNQQMDQSGMYQQPSMMDPMMNQSMMGQMPMDNAFGQQPMDPMMNQQMMNQMPMDNGMYQQQPMMDPMMGQAAPYEQDGMAFFPQNNQSMVGTQVASIIQQSSTVDEAVIAAVQLTQAALENLINFVGQKKSQELAIREQELNRREQELNIMRQGIEAKMNGGFAPAPQQPMMNQMPQQPMYPQQQNMIQMGGQQSNGFRQVA